MRTASGHLRVTLLLASLARGGAERVAVTLMTELVRRGHAVTLLTLAAEDDDAFAAPDGVQRVPLAVTGPSAGAWDAIRSNAQRLLAVRRAVEASAPDVVIAFQSTVNVTALLALAGRRTPVVVSERVDPRAHPLPRPWAALRRLTYPRAAALVVQTSTLEAWAGRVARGTRTRVIPNPLGIEPMEHREGQGDRKTLLAVGRLEPQKGYDLLLAAFARICEHTPEWDLLVLGEGSSRRVLEVTVDQLGLRGRVRLPGASDDVPAAMAHADAFVLSSRYEGFPNALLEAMAHGLPAVAADCRSGPATLVQHEHNGLLVQPESIEALAAGLDRLMLDDDLRRDLGAAARAVRETYAPARIADAWDALLRDVVT